MKVAILTDTNSGIDETKAKERGNICDSYACADRTRDFF